MRRRSSGLGGPPRPVLRRAALVLACCAGGLGSGGAQAAWAEATRVVYDGDAQARILVSSAAGEANDLEVLAPEGTRQVAFVDRSAGIGTMSASCTQISPIEVRCEAAGVEEVVVSAGDGDDTLAYVGDSPPTFALRLDGGTGADELKLGVKLDPIDLDLLGLIRLTGGAGDDDVTVHLGPSPIQDHPFTDLVVSIDTGTGNDVVTVDDRSAVGDDPIGGIGVALGPGSDFALADVTNVDNFRLLGQAGNDHIGLEGPGSARGGDGADILSGGAGDQRLLGGAGEDRLTGGDGSDDFCHGGTGTDAIGTDCEKIVSP